MRLACPAKINLHLEVGALRPDGFHEVLTLYQALELADDLELETEGEGIVLEVEGPCAGEVPAGDENLVLRAAGVLGGVRGRRLPGTRVRLTKRVPAGAGLGGGSSDAAAALRGLAAIHALPLEEGDLQRAAAELGSDVPFFLRGGTAVGKGRGERLTVLPDLPPLGVLLAVPRIRLPTPRVYAHLDLLRSSKEPLTAHRTLPNIGATIERLGRGESVELCNDLEVAAVHLAPGVRSVRAALEASRPLGVGMTGSGTAFFALYPDKRGARDALEGLSLDGIDTFVTAFRPWRGTAGLGQTELSSA